MVLTNIDQQEPAPSSVSPVKVPAISVIVPVFNEPRAMLLRSLQSVAGQTMGDFECLIVDESKEAESVEICATFAARDARFVHIRPDRRLGLASSLNLGLERSRGQWIARFDADDVCEPDRFERQVEFLQRHPEVGLVGTAMSIVDGDGRIVRSRRYPQQHASIAAWMQLSNAIAHPTVMMRRGVVQQHGGYRSDFRYSEDLELWLRMLANGVRFANLSQPLVRYRQTSFTRPAKHWHYNLRARTSNFALDRHLLLRLIGIAMVALFAVVPARLQSALYRSAILSRSAGPEL